VTIRVVVVDDNPIVRVSLARGFAAQGDIDLVGEAADGEDAVTLLQKVATDVIVMDEHMPLLSGLAATARLRDLGILTPVLILTADPRVAATVIDLSHVNVLLKGEAGIAETVTAVRSAARAS
jgi:DNA-binding NarL/FixJ family response regulator